MEPEYVLTVCLTVSFGLFLVCMGVSIVGAFHVRLKADRMLTDSPMVRKAVETATIEASLRIETRMKALETEWSNQHESFRKQVGRISNANRKKHAGGPPAKPGSDETDEEFELGPAFSPSEVTPKADLSPEERRMNLWQKVHR